MGITGITSLVYKTRVSYFILGKNDFIKNVRAYWLVTNHYRVQACTYSMLIDFLGFVSTILFPLNRLIESLNDMNSRFIKEEKDMIESLEEMQKTKDNFHKQIKVNKKDRSNAGLLLFDYQT